MSKLAIKGHATRGREVIEILEMLGGNNICKYNADCSNIYFYIGENSKNIYYNSITISHDIDFIIFTLEEFLEKFPYKVGGKVNSKYFKNYKIEKMEWIDTDNKIVYKLQGNGWYNVDELEPYKEKTIEERKYSDLRLPLDDDDKLATEVTIGGNKILPPNGYLIGKITQVDNGMIVEYVKKQPQYPKTYKECCDTLYINSKHDEYYEACLQGYPMQTFVRLLICRDAYWKIAGEELGLDKSWKPDWRSGTQKKYCIYNKSDSIQIGCWYWCNTILAFPTKEMRDTFYNNFKDLIEQCKELL